MPADNPSNLRGNLPTYLLLPEVVEELGLVQPGDPALTFELLDGSTREVTPDPLPIEEFRDWIFGIYGGGYPDGLPPDADGPLYLRKQTSPSGPRRSRPRPPSTSRITRCGPRAAASGSTNCADEIEAAAAADPDRPIVIDLRNNGGGDNTTFAPLRQAVQKVARANPGIVSLITGRGTFSAAGNFVTDLKVGSEKDGIRLVGEPPGGGLEHLRRRRRRDAPGEQDRRPDLELTITSGRQG